MSARERNGTASPASSIAQRTFTLTSLPHASTSSSSTARHNADQGRAGRRLHIPADVLKACKLAAGDAILVASTLSAKDLDRRLSLKDGGIKRTKANLDQQQVCMQTREISGDKSC